MERPECKDDKEVEDGKADMHPFTYACLFGFQGLVGGSQTAMVGTGGKGCLSLLAQCIAFVEVLKVVAEGGGVGGVRATGAAISCSH